MHKWWFKEGCLGDKSNPTPNAFKKLILNAFITASPAVLSM
jgi:hypothetical protein